MFKRYLKNLGIAKGPASMPFRRAFGSDETKAVLNVIQYYKNKQEDPPYYGYFQREYEELFSSKMDIKKGYSRAVATGSIACYIALRSCNLKIDSEVILSPVTDSSPLFSIIECGLKPVIADCEENSYNVSIDSIKRLITEKTSAIYLVHAAGDAANVEEIKNLADEKGLILIEDISQAPFSEIRTVNNQMRNVGTFGITSACSTMYRKTLHTSSSGGIIYTQDNEIYKSILEYSDRGRPTWRDDYDSRDPGSAVTHSLNYNTNEISCSVGIASLNRIEDTIKRRRLYKQKVYELFEDSPIFELPIYQSTSSPFLQPIFVKKKYELKKEFITKSLIDEKIAIAPTYKCFVYNWPITRKYVDLIEHKVASSNQLRGFNLFFNEKCGSKQIGLLKQVYENVLNSL